MTNIQGKKSKMSLTEKFGIWYLSQLARKHPIERVDIDTYILDEQERKLIIKTEQHAIRNAAIIGAISTLITSLASFLIWDTYSQAEHLFSSQSLYYWKIIGIVTLITSIAEILYLYYDILQKVYKLTVHAHMELMPGNQLNEAVVAALARAALELPNPNDSEININPKKESSKLTIFLTAVLYKTKVSLSIYIFRTLLKRVIGRAVSRAYLEFLAVPIVAFWNAWVARSVMHEAKIRVLGPSAAVEISQTLKNYLPEMSQMGQISVLRAISGCILSTADLHPNLELLFKQTIRYCNIPQNTELDNTLLYISDLKNLTETEKIIVSNTALYASVIDGKVTKREQKLLQLVYTACNKNYDYTYIRKITTQFRNGLLLNFKNLLTDALH